MQGIWTNLDLLANGSLSDEAVALILLAAVLLFLVALGYAILFMWRIFIEHFLIARHEEAVRANWYLARNKGFQKHTVGVLGVCIVLVFLAGGSIGEAAAERLPNTVAGVAFLKMGMMLIGSLAVTVPLGLCFSIYAWATLDRTRQERFSYFNVAKLFAKPLGFEWVVLNAHFLIKLLIAHFWH